METRQEQKDKEMLLKLAGSIAERLEAGTPRGTVKAMIVQSGMPEPDAAAILEAVEKDMRAARRRSALGSVLWGAFLVALGGGITLLTYRMADPGGIYLIGWGPALWGGWKVLSGIARMTNS